MNGRQQSADGDHVEPEGLTLGYRLRCGGYGRGEYIATINSHSDAIRNHRDCPGSPPPGTRP
ncbi:hypothetical protein K353_02380 [Kitasatospora sp. SolWspMP-SS2h]|nr:hypothetical protein K353_02380 [Kitasatospora sp. SolWspMP-SS2h]